MTLQISSFKVDVGKRSTSRPPHDVHVAEELLRSITIICRGTPQHAWLVASSTHQLREGGNKKKPSNMYFDTIILAGLQPAVFSRHDSFLITHQLILQHKHVVAPAGCVAQLFSLICWLVSSGENSQDPSRNLAWRFILPDISVKRPGICWALFRELGGSLERVTRFKLKSNKVNVNVDRPRPAAPRGETSNLFQNYLLNMASI